MAGITTAKRFIPDLRRLDEHQLTTYWLQAAEAQDCGTFLHPACNTNSFHLQRSASRMSRLRQPRNRQTAEHCSLLTTDSLGGAGIPSRVAVSQSYPHVPQLAGLTPL